MKQNEKKKNWLQIETCKTEKQKIDIKTLGEAIKQQKTKKFSVKRNENETKNKSIHSFIEQEEVKSKKIP